MISRFSLPQTLLFRTFVLLAGLLVTAAACSAVLAHLSEAQPRARQLAELAASVVNLTRSALVSADPQHRISLLADLSVRESLHVYPAEDSDKVQPLPDTLLFAYLRDDVDELLGHNTRLALAVNGQPGFWVSFHIEDEFDADDAYWVRLPRDRVERPPALRWGGFALVVLVVALVGAFMIVEQMARPLSQMARACRAVGRGERPTPVCEDGPEEVRILAQSLNSMSRDLENMEVERAEVLAGISHDIRTPLTRLRLALEMVDADESLHSTMAADIETMDVMLGQFLDYARGENREEARLVDPVTVVERVLQRYPTELDVRWPTLPWRGEYRLRERSLERALANLVDNAVKYAGAPVELHVREQAGLTGQTTQLVLEVRDHGPGIPEADLERIRQPFTRLEVARTGVAGTGLGLAIVERMARAHGGLFTLCNHPEGGLSACLSLPGRVRGSRPV